jgi:two-component system, OmpR family, sensor kinase
MSKKSTNSADTNQSPLNPSGVVSASNREADRFAEKTRHHNELRIRSPRERIKLGLLIHDFKVPLAVIEAGLNSLIGRPDKYGPLTSAQSRVIERAKRNIKVIQTLVNDALELGRSEAGIINPVPFRLSKLVEQAMVEMFDLADGRLSDEIRACTDMQTVKETLEGKGIQLRIDEKLWCETLYLDEGKIRQILRNLLTNALKYRKNIVELKLEKNDDVLEMSVTDDGEGIPRMFHEKIFESYFQMDANDICSVRGHGLGLAGVMVLVEDMGCDLFLESDEGKGARFVVRVPLRQSAGPEGSE